MSPTPYKLSRKTMASKAERGTKRTCQNDDCEARFYDLGRDPIICPICETPYALEVAAAAAAAAQAAADRGRRKKPEYQLVDDSKSSPVAEGEEALADIEVAEEAGAVADDETFLEEEEDDGANVGAIVGGGETEEET
jgi:uncharacterized protein (TIGR02300 family)